MKYVRFGRRRELRNHLLWQADQEGFDHCAQNDHELLREQ